MQLGMVGLGRMGANLSRRLMREGHEVVVYDVNADSVAQLESEGAIGTESLDDFVAKLSKPRAAWVMVPAAFAGSTVMELAKRMERDDIVIDGGNTYYREDVQRAKELAPLGIHYVDVGTSGGVFGLERGFCLMIDAETAPLAEPEYYRYDLDIPEIAEVWRRGSVVASWLLDLTAAALAESHDLAGFSGRVSDSGEGRWTVQAAVDVGVPAHILTAALFERFDSRGENEFANRLLSAMRKQFGGHAEKA